MNIILQNHESGKMTILKSIQKLSFTAGIFMTIPCTAFSQSTLADNWYIGGFGGVAVLQPFRPWKEPIPTNSNDIVEETGSIFDQGRLFGAVIGTEVDENWRLEGELSLQQSDFRNDFLYSLFSNGNYIPGFKSKYEGEISSISLLANIWYDFDRSDKISPYIGAGAGIGYVSARQLFHTFGNSANGNDFTVLDDSDTGFAFQLGGGVRTMIAQNTWLDFGYRFRGITGLELFYEGQAAIPGGNTFNLFTHTFQIGLTYKFR